MKEEGGGGEGGERGGREVEREQSERGGGEGEIASVCLGERLWILGSSLEWS